MNTPLLICLTPVRNEAWVLNAFLKATSLWADYIIIADQGSTDGSRDIALSFPKVILVDNPIIEMHQAQTRQLLLKNAEKIIGEKILFTLDADEFLSGDFKHSVGWKKIMNSKEGEIFFFKWKNLCNPPTDYFKSPNWMYWACNLNLNIIECDFPNNYIHEWRLPYPKSNVKENYIEDIFFIHVARVNEFRQINKERFYKVITKFNEPKKSIISLYRMYNFETNENKIYVDDSIFSFYLINGLDLLKEIDLLNCGEYYTQQILLYLEEKGLKYFQGLDIWQKSFLQEYNLKDPRSIWMKMIHFYLKNTKSHNNLIVNGVDKILKISGI